MTTVTDADDRVTRIERDGDGTPLAIVAPGGARTTLEVGADGFLSRVEDAAGKATKLDYDAAGRLSELIDRRGGRHSFGYDDAGRLVRDEDPTGKAQTLSRKETDEGYIVTLTSPEGRKHTWEVGLRPDGDAFLEATGPSGAKTTSWVGIDGVATSRSRPGRRPSSPKAPTRAGARMSRSRASSSGARRAGARRRRRASARSSLADVSDPLSVRALTDTYTTNGRKSVLSYDAEARKETTTSPEGRITTTFYDAKGHPTRFEPGPGVAPITYEYDERGRLHRVAQGKRAYTLRLRRAATGRTCASTARPPHGADLRRRRPSHRHQAPRRRHGTLRVRRRGLPHRGRPGRRAASRAQARRPRRAGRRTSRWRARASTRAHDGDGRLTAAGVDGDRTTYSYANGRATGAAWADAAVEYGYDGTADRPASMTRAATGGGGAEGSALSYDGAQTTGITTTGTAAGAYTFGYDDNGFLTSSKLVSGAQTVASAITRDKDGLVTADGPFAIARGGAGGTASAITGAGLTMALGRDDVGGLESRTLTVGANQRYKVAAHALRRRPDLPPDGDRRRRRAHLRLPLRRRRAPARGRARHRHRSGRDRRALHL